MTDQEALLRAVIEQPADDTVRLAYADWFEEHDEPERAEFIRAQCAAWPHFARERELLKAHFQDWFPAFDKPQGFEVGSTVVILQRGELEVHRGFVESLTCLASDWLTLAPVLHWHPSLSRPCAIAAQPIRTVRTTLPGPELFDVDAGWNFDRDGSIGFRGRRQHAVSREDGSCFARHGQRALFLWLFDREFPGIEFVLPPPEGGAFSSGVLLAKLAKLAASLEPAIGEFFARYADGLWRPALNARNADGIVVGRVPESDRAVMMLTPRETPRDA